MNEMSFFLLETFLSMLLLILFHLINCIIYLLGPVIVKERVEWMESGKWNRRAEFKEPCKGLVYLPKVLRIGFR